MNSDNDPTKDERLKKTNGKDGDNLIPEEFPIVDALDSEILMHRDSHFGGKFDFMLDYYQKEGKGVRDDFPIERIRYLAELEKHLGQNLAATILSGPEAEQIATSLEAYKKLRDLYEAAGLKSKNAMLIADLILAEDVDEEDKAIAAVAAQKASIVPALVELLRSEEFYDPLFPGYGLAPQLAVQSLGKIGDKRAMISLFEAIGQGDFFSDDNVLEAMFAIGDPAKEFLLKVVHGRPINVDNEKAAVMLVRFKDEPGVAETCLQLLQDKEFRKDIPLATYLILACDGLKNPEQRSIFCKLAEDKETPKPLLMDIKTICKSWKKS